MLHGRDWLFADRPSGAVVRSCGHYCVFFRNRSMMVRRSSGVMSRQRVISSTVRPQPVQVRPALSSLQMLTQGLSTGV